MGIQSPRQFQQGSSSGNSFIPAPTPLNFVQSQPYGYPPQRNSDFNPYSWHDVPYKRNPSLQKFPPGILYPRESYSPGICFVGGDHNQLVLEMPVMTPQKSTKVIRILVDTGAQTNRIRKGHYPTLMSIARTPLKLNTVDGTPLMEETWEQC